MNTIFWAHIVSTGAIIYGYNIDQVIAQLPDDFYGPIYERHSWPMQWTIEYINWGSIQVYEVL